jgi:phosphonate transport system substrate-binding protein
VPNEEDVERRVRWEGLTAYLSRKLAMPVELVQTGSYSPAIEALRARKLEVVGLAPFAFLIAESRGVAAPLVVPGSIEGHPRVYTSGLIVPASSPIHTIDDVKTRAASLTFSWADPASASGHLVPRAYFESIGINAERDFKQVMFAMSHTASILTVKAAKVDLAAITTTSLRNMITLGRIGPDDVRVVWESEPIMASLIGIRADLPAAFRQEVQNAYLAFAEEDPAAWAKIAELYNDPGVRWVAATHEDIDPLRRLAGNVKHIDLLGQ